MSKLIASLRRRVLRALGILLPSDVFAPVVAREAEDLADGAAYLEGWRPQRDADDSGIVKLTISAEKMAADTVLVQWPDNTRPEGE